MINVKFDDPKDEKLKELAFQLVERSHEFIFEGKPLYSSLRLPCSIFRCEHNMKEYNDCKGICFIGKSPALDPFYNANRLMVALKYKSSTLDHYLQYVEEDITRNNIPFHKVSHNKFILDKERLITKLEILYEDEEIFCKKFSSNVLKNSIYDLPDEYELTPIEVMDADEELSENMEFYKMIATEVAPIFARALAVEIKAIIDARLNMGSPSKEIKGE